MHTSTNASDSSPESTGEEFAQNIDFRENSERYPIAQGPRNIEESGSCNSESAGVYDVVDLSPDVDAIRESLGMMKLNQKGQAMYHGETHWAALLNELSEVKAIFERGKQFYVDNPMKIRMTDQFDDDSFIHDGFPFSIGGLTRSDIIMLFPDKSDCDVLIRRYFDVFDPILHIVHRPTFEEEYENFWPNIESVDIAWIGLLLSMMSLALQSYKSGDNDKCPASLKGKETDTWVGWQNATQACLVTGKFMYKGSLTIVKTLFLWLMVETRMNLVGKWANQAWVSVGVLIRVAQSMVKTFCLI